MTYDYQKQLFEFILIKDLGSITKDNIKEMLKHYNKSKDFEDYIYNNRHTICLKWSLRYKFGLASLLLEFQNEELNFIEELFDIGTVKNENNQLETVINIPSFFINRNIYHSIVKIDIHENNESVLNKIQFIFDNKYNNLLFHMIKSESLIFNELSQAAYIERYVIKIEVYDSTVNNTFSYIEIISSSQTKFNTCIHEIMTKNYTMKMFGKTFEEINQQELEVLRVYNY